MKVLIIGEAPSKNEPTPRPIEGRIGRRLADYAGLTFEEFLAKTERVNLLDVRQDTAEHGFRFDAVEARRRAYEVNQQIKPFQVVLLLGKRVAQAMGCNSDYFESNTLLNCGALYVIPHPSGVSRWWNDIENQQKARNFMTEVFRDA